MANRRSRWDVLSGKANEEMAEKKKALRPNAERGKAVAVPRWSGQFNAAFGDLVIEPGVGARRLTCFDGTCEGSAPSNACKDGEKA